MPTRAGPRAPARSLARRLATVALALIALLAALVAVGVAATWLSPRPSIALIQWLFERGAARTNAALEPLVPPGIDTLAGEPYQQQPRALALDLHRPAAAAGRALPLIVWIHGGAFVSGRKEDISAYARLLAARGFTVASVDYTLAPEATYPTQLREVNAAVAHLLREAPRLGLDTQRVLLAGDSAGAQLAAVSTAPAYAQAVGLVPALQPAQLRGVLLFCGVYDFGLLRYDGLVGHFLGAVAWGFLGTRDFRDTPAFAQASVLRHLGPGFPPAFVTAGNGDPLLPHSRALAARLGELGVAVETLFFADDLAPALPHEYQFDLGRPEGRLALERAAAFAAARLR